MNIKKNHTKRIIEKEFEFSSQINELLYSELNIDDDIKEKLRLNKKIIEGLTYFIYIRISKEWEYDMSFTDQVKTLLSNANKNWHKIIIKWEKKSWSKNWRDDFNDMINMLLEDSKKDINKRTYGWIYVLKLDRFARNSIDFTRWEKLLDAWYRIISATETIENTPTWRLLFRMLSSFAIYESEKLSNRQTLSEIQNLVRVNLKALWWKLDIFWYRFTNTENEKARSEDKILEVDQKQKLIIIKVYDIYSEISDENSKNFIKTDTAKWKIIWERLTKREQNIIIKSKISDSIEENLKVTDIKKNYNVIRNIVENKQKLKYNWVFERNININDELIINYINNNNTESSDFELKWNNEVGWVITFKFIFDDLAIISDKQYSETRKTTQIYNKKPKKIWRYSNILKYQTNEWNIYELEAYTVSWKPAIQYRLKERWNSDIKCNISQGIIDKLIIKDKRIKNIKFNDEQIEFFKKQCWKYIISYNDTAKRSLTMKAKAYQRTIDDYDYQLTFKDHKSDDIDLINRNKQLYRWLIKEVQEEINEIEDFTNESINIYMSIYNNINEIFLEKDSEFANAKLRILIDSIYLDENRNIKHIELNSFIKEVLWMKD